MQTSLLLFSQHSTMYHMDVQSGLFCDLHTCRFYNVISLDVIASALGKLGLALKDTSYFGQVEITLGREFPLNHLPSL